MFKIYITICWGLSKREQMFDTELHWIFYLGCLVKNDFSSLQLTIKIESLHKDNAKKGPIWALHTWIYLG